MTPLEGREKTGKGKGREWEGKGNKPIILMDWCGGCSLRIVEL